MAICLYNGSIVNRFSVIEQCAVLIDKGKIADVFSQKRFLQKKFPPETTLIDTHGAYITPGLIDTHIHGFAGFGVDDYNAESILRMAEELAKLGVTAFHPTLYPTDETTMIKGILAIVEAIGKEQRQSPRRGARIMGIHLEGPFLSPEKCGVQKPETIQPVDVWLFDRLWEAADGFLVNMTVAPEIKNMRELALSALKKGVILQAGHTDALYENMLEGMQAGILHTTHLFNAMRHMHHRNPGAVGAVLINNDMSCEVIADGVHVHPDLFKLLLRDKAMDKIVLVTDALLPTCQKTGPFFANGEEVVFEGGCWHRKADGVVAGSSLTMPQGLKNLIHFGFPLVDAVRCATANPAEVMGYTSQGRIAPCLDADIAVFDENWEPQITIIGGEIIMNRLNAAQ
ncbi:MAG: N-acetylglucosamine-6-phosphate deacetylase [Spirochaetaceae bacterium]|jgi:N-acetylglucosamine-6-phosphate deacetylase|nr:N-acetylglucosamine-6-phosphate deacetylase [Spirochaetaceae bacterium]